MRPDPFAGAARALAALSPRTAGVAVMSTLAFGVIVGSGASSLANNGTPIIVASAPRPASANTTPNANTSSASSSPGSSSASSPQTVTQTVPAQTVTAGSPTTPTTSSGNGSGSSTTPASNGSPLPPVKHVFVIMLSQLGYNESFGANSQLPYLADKLRRQGELLQNYYAVAPSPLSNAIALLSGQGPTAQTLFDCPTYTAISPSNVGKFNQVLGSGCVYPATTQTLPGQLVAKNDAWKAYVEGINDGPPGTAKTCRHPVLGAADGSQASQTGDPYVTWRNPVVYFQSLDQGKACAKHDVGLDQLAIDLKSAKDTPTLSYIVPGQCDDGSGLPCVPSAPPNPQAADQATDAFLRSTVDLIKRSPAYKKDGGLIAITSDEAPQSGATADASACCNNPVYPNLVSGAQTSSTSSSTTSSTTPSTAASSTSPISSGTTSTGSSSTTSTGPTSTSTSTTNSGTTTSPTSNGQTTPTGGGGQVGLLLISRYVKPGSTDAIDYYNHYSLLASIEALFSLSRLGYSNDPSLPVFDAATYNNYKGG